MLFNSPEFIFVFLPVTFIVYFGLSYKQKTSLAKVFLVASSLFFYSWWNVIYLPLIIGSLLFNFFIGKKIREKRSKKILVFGIFCNLFLLGYFKYTDFFIFNFNALFETQINYLNLALPLAISFFTFQQIAYLVDSFKGETKEYNFINYSVFVTFFPQLIAGPIVHHKEMMPQFEDRKNHLISSQNILLGLYIFSIGLFKKVVIADYFATYADAGYDSDILLSFYESWATSLSYTFQLYFDFSGYSDMAIGLALLFNIKLPINFNSPYKALNIQDFWRRWHITLSRFLRDYIYIPLGGNKKSQLITYRNLMATFILGGIWHGAGWTFVFWGVLHGLAISLHRMWMRLGLRMWSWLAWFITFNFINITWVFFRAESWGDAERVLKGMFGLQKGDSFAFSLEFVDKLSMMLNVSLHDVLSFGYKQSVVNEMIIAVALLFIPWVLLFENSNKWISFAGTLSLKRVVFASIAFAIAVTVMLSSSTAVFLYFNF